MFKKTTIKYFSKLLVVLFGFGLVINAESAVYRWVDENGNVHYGDSPARPSNAEKVETVTAPKADKFAEERFKRQQEYLKSLESEAKPTKLTKEQKARSEKVRLENCKQVQENLQTLQTLGRIFKELPNGERQFLDDTEKQKEIKIATEQVAEYCQ